VEGPRDEEREERRGDEGQRLVARQAVVGRRPEAQRHLRRRLHGLRFGFARGLFDRIGLLVGAGWDGTPRGGERGVVVVSGVA